MVKNHGKWSTVVISSVLAICLIELGLRWLGPGVFKNEVYQIESTPSGALKGHFHKGFVLNPGKFQVEVNRRLSFVATHNDDSCRITSEIPVPLDLPEIGVYGCSFTYGWGLNDAETFPFLVQQELRDYKVTNWSVPGYGTVQALQQLRQRLKQAGNLPKVVVLVYGSFHDDRNALTRLQRRFWSRAMFHEGSVYQKVRLPFVEQDGHLNFAPADSLYKPWGWSRSLAVANFTNLKTDQFLDRLSQPEETSRHLILAIDLLCKSYGSRVMVAGILDNRKTSRMLQSLSAEGIPVVDISVNTLDPAFNLSPLDDHPNARANRLYARELIQFLTNDLELNKAGSLFSN